MDEPICILKVELDGTHTEDIRVFENDRPEQIVDDFGDNYGLSNVARQRLLEQIREQIEMDEQDL